MHRLCNNNMHEEQEMEEAVTLIKPDSNEETNEENTDCLGVQLASLFESPPSKPLTLTAFNNELALTFNFGEPDLAGGQGEVIWESAEQLLELFANATAGSHHNYWQGKNVVELGTGVGRLGLFLAALGAHVTLTDQPCIIEAPYLLKNVKQNGLEEQVTIRELDWACVESGKYDCWIAPLQPIVNIVVASDCYFFHHFTSCFIQSLLAVSNQSTDIFLSNNGRWNELFFKELEKSFNYYFINPKDPFGPPLDKNWDTIGSEARVVKCKKRS